MRINRTLSILMLATLLAMASVAPVMATSILPASLQHLSQKAELIFRGKTISNEVKIDESSGHIATVTTFEVIDVIKGQVADKHTIKQLGGQLPGNKRIHTIHGVPQFSIDEEYVVFLPKPSTLGFASPLGLSQGRFVVSEKNGVTTVSNGRTISDLTNENANRNTAVSRSTAAINLRALPEQPASASLSDFLQTVRELASE